MPPRFLPQLKDNVPGAGGALRSSSELLPAPFLTFGGRRCAGGPRGAPKLWREGRMLGREGC